MNTACLNSILLNGAPSSLDLSIRDCSDVTLTIDERTTCKLLQVRDIKDNLFAVMELHGIAVTETTPFQDYPELFHSKLSE